MFCCALACDGASAVSPIKAARQAAAVMVRFIGKPLLYCNVAMFGLLLERSQASGEKTKSGRHQVALAKSTDVFQIVKFIRAMLLMVRDDQTLSDIPIASENDSLKRP